MRSANIKVIVCMATLVFLIAGFMPSAVFASEGHAGGIPMSVTYQLINFTIYIGLLLYFLRHPVKNFFRSREEVYKQALLSGESARKDAEQKKHEIQQRLRDLEATSSESIDRARAEAASLKQQIALDAKDLSERLRQEASRTTALEVERAQNLLRDEMLAQSVALAQRLLLDKIAEPDQKRLQTEFVDKIQEVR